MAWSLSVSVANDLPALAWYCVIRNSAVEVECGPAVECFPAGFFEGAWSGEFDDNRFDLAATVCGSGVRIVGDSVILVPPSHTLEAIYYAHVDGGLIAANSLAFLLTRIDEQPLFNAHFGLTMASALFGIDGFQPTVLRTASYVIRRTIFHNLVVSEGAIRSIMKPDPFSFRDFASYKTQLTAEMRTCFENAVSAARRASYDPLGTCSSGYDSAAGLAMASELGCRDAVALSRSRDGTDDSGDAVAAALGIRLQVFPRFDCAPAQSIHEFFASGFGAEDIVYTPFADHLAHRILLTGFHGDRIWTKLAPSNSVLARGDASGSTLTDFRLRQNFIHFPIPFIGARHHPAVTAISNSAEMQPYSIGGWYDRPIPRRLAEERGVDRMAFGREKKAASIRAHRERDLQPATFVEQVDRAIADQASFLTLGKGVSQWWFAARLSVVARIEWLAERVIKRSRFAGSFIYRTRNLFGGSFSALEHDTPIAFFEFIAGWREIDRRYGKSGNVAR